MIEKKRAVTAPLYMDQFKCIGPECEDSCCVGWRVDIDNETYKKYQKIRDDELTPIIEKHVTRNRNQGQSKESYAKIKLDSQAGCPFLNEKMLCRIQLKRGEDYLSNVCATYPRTVNGINGTLERSATVSCPEVARLALLNPSAMVFDVHPESRAIRNIIVKDLRTDDLKYNGKPQRYLTELRAFTMDLLQDRSYTLNERLIILGLFIQKTQVAVSNNNINEIPNIMESYKSIIEDGSLKQSIQGLPIQYNIQMKLLKEIVDKRYYMGVSSKRYLECLSEFLKGVKYTNESAVEEIGQRYQEASKEYYEPFMNEHEYILENYLVNHAFKNLFPFSDSKSLFDSYMMLVIHFALIKMHLIGMAGFHSGLNKELVIKLIQSFSKTVEHNNAYLKGVADSMRQNSFNTMPYMAILIKN